jgi:peptidoglycan/xylan/chitin deacetylase (PgdA/CDA1 family)/GT2 family glycosyltransferase
VLDQDFPAQEYEVIVVVDGSTDGTAEMLRSITVPCRLSIIEQPNQGPAIARNNAVAAARGTLLLFLDDDIVCRKSLVREHVAAHGGPEFRVSHGPILLSPKSPGTLAGLARTRNFKTRHLKFIEDPLGHLGFFAQINFCIRRDVFLNVGGFDPHLLVSEDTELGVRLLKLGVSCIYVPNAVVQELYSKSTRTYIRCDALSYGVAEVYLCRKHPDYRPSSGLNNLGASGVTRRLLREVGCRSWISLHVLLGPLLWVLERMSWVAACQRAGLFLFGLCQRLAFLRGAVREAGSYRALKMAYAMRLPVLLYHNVGPARAARFPQLTISPERFERQMRWLSARGYTTIRSRDWIAWVNQGVALPPKPVLLTFDDGYADLATYAFPVLRRYGFTAEVFVVTRPPWGTNAWDHDGHPGTHALMTPDDIGRWSRDGIHFGAHSRTHPDLTTLSAAELQEQIDGSAADLVSITGEMPTAFAYPYGYCDATVEDAVKSRFRCAYSVEPGLNDLSIDLFALKRVAVPHDRGLVDFACRVALGWSPVAELRSVIRIRSRVRKAMRLMRLTR